MCESAGFARHYNITKQGDVSVCNDAKSYIKANWCGDVLRGKRVYIITTGITKFPVGCSTPTATDYQVSSPSHFTTQSKDKFNVAGSSSLKLNRFTTNSFFIVPCEVNRVLVEQLRNYYRRCLSGCHHHNWLTPSNTTLYHLYS